MMDIHPVFSRRIKSKRAVSAHQAGVPGSRDILAPIAICLLVQAMISLLAACIPVLAPLIASARQWNVDVIALYAPIVYLVAFLINFRVPHLLSRLGGMGLSLVGLASSAIGILCVAFPSIVLCAVAAVAIGVATGIMNPASTQILGPRSSAQTAGLIMAIKQTGVPMGSMLAGMLTPVIAFRFGWQAAIVFLAGTSAALVLALLPTVGWLNGTRTEMAGAPYRPVALIRRLMSIEGMASMVAAGTLFSAALVCLRSFLTVYLVKELGLSLGVAGLAFGISQAAGMVGQIGWAILSDRLLSPNATMALIGILIAAASLLTAMFSSRWPVAGIGVVEAMFGLGAAGFAPVVFGEVARRAPPGQSGTLASGANLFLMGGVVVGPLAFGGIASFFTYRTAFVALAACILGVLFPLARSSMGTKRLD
jgi:MFS family permease